MKEIKVNGWTFVVMSKEEKEKYYPTKDNSFTKIDYNNYLYNDFSRHQLYKSVGYGTVDFAIPQDVLESPEIQRRINLDNDLPVYYYGIFSRFGRILWDNDVRELLIDIILTKIEKNEYEEIIL
jgi:hypothetical protein